MERFSFFVGLDVGKTKFSAAFRRDGKLFFTMEYPNTAAGINAFLKDLLSYEKHLDQILVSLEHCGVYIEQLTEVLYGEGIFTWVWNPLIAKHAPLELNRSKTDDRDAQSMAQLGELHQMKAIQFVPKTPQQAQIKDLFQLRKQLVKKRTQCLNQLDANLCKAIPNPMTTTCLEQQMELFNAQIKQIEKALKKLVFSQDRVKKIYTILLSIPGIGPVTATQLIYLTQGFTSFQSYKQLAKYIGTLPLEQSSGTSLKRKPKTSKKAHKSLKANLTQGAISVCREGLFFHQYYQFERNQQNKEHLKVINSIRNTILKLAFKLVQKEQKFDPELFLKNKISWQQHLILS